jgi:hypothetical protein
VQFVDAKKQVEQFIAQLSQVNDVEFAKVPAGHMVLA